ncbi:MAG: bifunctional methylenetetrahydrofolate dehydrogenase/methenyltetrahydrofolate cyclohydrolase FolD [Armatimonadota bacterium]|nr:bifunctional methylenetetrahydrofolate dehydrogenase/methenyltetrahydrofolate cyclohydrolase FolD [Armatimonadota bacterium]MDR5703994.1 bifunctional methylenetetrahydrofolate dehydrogenase/methenyltetrahydrofolate cyclohydrolase FolD [Armatimonadota bacterium]MDR7435079.1 bifunctional methylenetetrahydrofolate dehydrogenase/methenyltetrahydrofolate cyclohydrolase FolD [Armatimonadota bacterium]
MAARVLDGKALARSVEEEVRRDVQAFVQKHGISPCLAALLVGDDPVSSLYVRRKAEACGRVGIRSETFRLPREIHEEEILALIADLNRRSDVHGILVQLPLPPHLREEVVTSAILPEKDVDGLHPMNVGYLFLGRPRMVPATPRGILELLRWAGVEVRGKEAVVVGRSPIVGRPTAALLLSQHATVTICHSRTTELSAHTRRAEILVVAAGRPRLIRGEMVKPGAVVIDVGVNRVDGKLVGDVDFAEVVEVASAITPVPGGVGPMTIAMLLRNTLQAALAQLEGNGCTLEP